MKLYLALIYFVHSLFATLMEKSSLTLTKDYENYFLSVKVIKSETSPEDHILFNLTSEEDELKWALQVNLIQLIDIDPIFKKFPDIADICNLLEQSFNENKIELNFRDQKAVLKFRVAYIKQEAFPELVLEPFAEEKENPLIFQLKSLHKEIEALKQKRKVQVISCVGDVVESNSLKGTLMIKRTEDVVFHGFIEYITQAESIGEESLSLLVTNEQNEEVVKEKMIFKTYLVSSYRRGGYHPDANHVSFMFIEKIPKGKNTITVLKKGSALISTFYLLAEI